MRSQPIEIKWPNGKTTFACSGEDWLLEAKKADISIPTGCLTGSCGACEIEVNGEVLRACIHSIPRTNGSNLKVDFSYDPYWE